MSCYIAPANKTVIKFDGRGIDSCEYLDQLDLVTDQMRSLELSDLTKLQAAIRKQKQHIKQTIGEKE